MDQSGLPQSRQVVQRGERFMQSQPVQRAFWDKETSPASPDNHSAGYGMSSRETDADEQEDELYGEAVELVRRLNKASVSLLQRRLRIGYTRAARLIDLMEAQGIVGPPTEGSKPREVLPVKK
jgi:DNA segregation ATPase FtsK/SpoIIIE-like protein